MYGFFYNILMSPASREYSAPVVTDSANDAVSPYNSVAGIRISNDGNVYSRGDKDGATSWTNRGQWIDPIDLVDNLHDCRVTNITNDVFDNEAAAEDVWVLVDGDMDWEITDTGVASRSISFDYEIRDAADTTVAATTSGACTLSIENTA